MLERRLVLVSSPMAALRWTAWQCVSAWQRVSCMVNCMTGAHGSVPNWRCRRYRFSFATGPESVGMATGATIHTAHGLKVKVAQRQQSQSASEPSKADLATV